MFLLYLTQLIHQIKPKLRLTIRRQQTRGRNLLTNQPVNQQQLKHRLNHLLNRLQNNRKPVSYTSFHVNIHCFFVSTFFYKGDVAVILLGNTCESWILEVAVLLLLFEVVVIYCGVPMLVCSGAILWKCLTYLIPGRTLLCRSFFPLCCCYFWCHSWNPCHLLAKHFL